MTGGGRSAWELGWWAPVPPAVDPGELIEPGVRVMATGRGVTDTKMYDREAVIDRYGIPPELVPDFVGLKGDTSDNIAGVPGIGDKTATQLLQEWGDLEGVLAKKLGFHNELCRNIKVVQNEPVMAKPIRLFLSNVRSQSFRCMPILLSNGCPVPV